MAEKHSSISDRIKCFVLHWVLILVTGNLANVPTSLEKEKNLKFGNGIQIKNLILKNLDNNNNNSQTNHSTSLRILSYLRETCFIAKTFLEKIDINFTKKWILSSFYFQHFRREHLR